jgi:cellulose synthase/poly-beta-1,6-N-acetylglucosamine synthase-like glycosyltransferase
MPPLRRGGQHEPDVPRLLATVAPMTTSPAVSVVVPIGRAGDDVAVQLRALHEQDVTGNVEFVLTLNTDDPAQRTALEAIVEPLGDPRFRIVVEGVRRGAAAARNAGAAAALGDTLAFCDADDIVDRSWLRLLLAELETCDAVGGRLVDFGASEREQQARPSATPDGLPTFLGVPYIVSASLALPHATFDDAGGFDEELVRCEDIAFSWVLVDRDKQLGYAPDAIVQYRHRTGVPDMMRQHFMYGRGMSQVLMRYGVPGADGSKRSLFTPNGQKTQKRTALGTLRRASIAAGRLTGLVEERLPGKGAR